MSHLAPRSKLKVTAPRSIETSVAPFTPRGDRNPLDCKLFSKTCLHLCTIRRECSTNTISNNSNNGAAPSDTTAIDLISTHPSWTNLRWSWVLIVYNWISQGGKPVACNCAIIQQAASPIDSLFLCDSVVSQKVGVYGICSKTNGGSYQEDGNCLICFWDGTAKNRD